MVDLILTISFILSISDTYEEDKNEYKRNRNDYRRFKTEYSVL